MSHRLALLLLPFAALCAAGAQTDRPAMRPLWSFQPVKNPPIPRTPYDQLSNNPIDRFIFQKLAQRGLRPSPLANRSELIRRVTVDLTGLPPTPQEVAAFVGDRSPNAYEKVVDRLLASPAYGERWGRHWLDVVRYGESNGYEQNHLRESAWPYRDYVIRSFNEDKPYPQFIAEQLAGDVIGRGDVKVDVATGYLVAGLHDTVGIQEEQGVRQQRSNDLDDIVSTTGAAFLGLTVGCAKCHDHKFDPIPQRDYYRLTACFAGVHHGDRELADTPESLRRKAIIKSLDGRRKVIEGEINGIELAVQTEIFKSRSKAGLRPAVNAKRNLDEFPSVQAKFIRFTILATRENSEPCLDEIQVYGPYSDSDLALASLGARATASSLLPGFSIHQIENLNDGQLGNEHSWISATPGTGWAQIELPDLSRINKVVWSRDAAETDRFDDRLPTKYRIEVSVDGESFQTVSTEAGRADSNEHIDPNELVKAMSASQKERRAKLMTERAELAGKSAALSSLNKAYIGTFSEPEQTYVLNRGDVMQRLDKVSPGALSQIAALPCDLVASESAKAGTRLVADQSKIQNPKSKMDQDRRLALARWIGSPKNPLTARVMANRVWQYHFGRGIVGTPSDFGRNGEKPTHPELLDWVASCFMEPQTSDSYACGWHLKPLHRLIVTSYTYRQTSAPNSRGMAVDAGNSLLWRMPLKRMEAEAIRDSVLQTSGKLDRRMGGPGFLLFKYRVVNVAIYEPLETFGPETWRRSVYQHAARSNREEMLGAFDCPECSTREPRRPTTTTALQALTLLNGAFIQQQAGFFAERVEREAAQRPDAIGSTQNAIRRAFELAFGRKPSQTEERAAQSLIKSHGLKALCRALMNANEFLYY